MGRKRDKQATARRLLDKLTYAIARALPGAAIEVGGAFVGLPPGVTTVAKAVTDKLLSLRAEQKTREALLKADVTAAETQELSKRFSAVERALLTAAGLPVEAPDNLAELQDQLAGGKEKRLERAVEILFDQTKTETDDVAELASALLAWPRPCVGPGTQRLAEHFVGRGQELAQLRRAVRAAKSVICVVGMAGQGKSALVAEWYKRVRNWPADRGLFWCRPYDTGYTYAAFLGDVLPYVAGAAYDPREHTTADAQTQLLCQVLRRRPTLIVLDGAERWLRRWAADRDAPGAGASAADRAVAEEALEMLLADAPSWDSGSGLLLTTRALPAALDDALKVTIGAGRPAGQRELAGLDDTAAARLLRRLGVRGTRDDLLAAAREYANHPLALRVLAGLLVKLYGGDVRRRPEIDVIAEEPAPGRLRHLLERIVGHRADDLPLLGLLAACLVPAPVALLAGVLGGDEKAMRGRLAELADWRLVSFDAAAGLADLHALIRQHLLARAGDDETAERRKQIARWFGGRPLPAEPATLEDVRPLLLATEHALAAGDPRLAAHYLFGRPAGRHYGSLDAWLRAFGHLARDVELVGACIGRYETLVYEQGRTELRNELAMAYNNRGIARRDQGDLAAAVADYDKAIAIREALVHDEGRTELRNDLASSYNNRGVARRAQGELAAAVADYDKAIEIGEALVQKEGRTELRNDLAGAYNNRGLAVAAQGELAAAVADYDKAVEIYEALVHDEGRRELAHDLADALFNRALAHRQAKRPADARRDMQGSWELYEESLRGGQLHLVPLFLRITGNLAGFLAELGEAGEAARRVNEALAYAAQLLDAGGATELLRREAARFYARLAPHRKALTKAGLDVERFDDVARRLGVDRGS